MTPIMQTLQEDFRSLLTLVGQLAGFAEPASRRGNWHPLRNRRVLKQFDTVRDQVESVARQRKSRRTRR